MQRLYLSVGRLVRMGCVCSLPLLAVQGDKVSLARTPLATFPRLTLPYLGFLFDKKNGARPARKYNTRALYSLSLSVTGFSLHSDGGGHGSLTLGYDGEERKLGDKYAVTEGKYGTLGMNGREVYKFATREVRGDV